MQMLAAKGDTVEVGSLVSAIRLHHLTPLTMLEGHFPCSIQPLKLNYTLKLQSIMEAEVD